MCDGDSGTAQVISHFDWEFTELPLLSVSHRVVQSTPSLFCMHVPIIQLVQIPHRSNGSRLLKL